MYEGQNVVYAMLGSGRKVFRLKDISLLTRLTDPVALAKKLNYAVQTGKILNPRKGIYALPGYETEELASRIYTPSYLSLSSILQRAGVIFQYDSGITMVSYLSRELEVDGNSIRYRKIKDTILSNPKGILVDKLSVSRASPERAFLDILYLEPHRFFDRLEVLDREKIRALYPIYHSEALERRVLKLTGI